MIRYIENGDIFASRADVLVNPVNCAGVMGKGLALEFRQRFPHYFMIYKELCDAHHLRPGQPCCVRLAVRPDFGVERPGVVLFPTKDHWKGRSRLEWIDQGLAYMKTNAQQWALRSVAMPQVGCGLGGLRWEQVRPLVENYFGDDQLDVEVYVRTTERARDEPALVRRSLFDDNVGLDECQTVMFAGNR